MYFRRIWLDPLLGREKPSEEKIAKLRDHMEMNLHVVESTWLENKEFLTGNTMTVADIFAACEIEQTRKSKLLINGTL